MRSEVISVVTRDYVRAAYGLGVGRFAVVLRHVVPNALNSVLALAAL
jgi:peptide/nickel transport system permease protein